jgi:hypothetical protein
LSSCQRQNTDGYPKPDNLGLLDDLPCNAPCWQTITPGITHVDEVKDVLENSIYVNDYFEEKVDNEVKLIRWESVTDSLNSISFCKDRVFTLLFRITYNFPLSEFINKYGDPEIIQIGEYSLVEEEIFVIQLKYLFKGISISVFSPTVKQEISPNSQINQIVYYNPNFDDCLVGFFEVDDGIPWSGYGPINTDN